ncbi:MAG: glycerophosphodiester phosphodiesterase, partial [Verrucomicrobiales bacterium]
MRPTSSIVLFLLVCVNNVWSQDIVAHRGASFDAPENTLAAFRLAWKQGADAIEGDFQLTKDQHIVCLHDVDLQRTSNDPRKIADMTLAEVRQVDVGTWKHPRFKGERIPTLTEILALVPRGKRLFLEIKCGTEIIEPLRKIGLFPDKVVIICFDREVIRQCRKQLPQLKAHWLTSYKQNVVGQWKPSEKELAKTLRELDASGLDTKADPERVTPTLVAKLREANLEFHCWTVDDVVLAKQFQKLGVDSITTNRPAWL